MRTNKFSIGWLIGINLRSIVKWAYPANFRPVYLFFDEKISSAQKRVTSENQLTKQK